MGKSIDIFINTKFKATVNMFYSTTAKKNASKSILKEIGTLKRGKNEILVQQWISGKFCECFSAVDTHKHEVMLDAPISGSGISTRSGKPDFTSAKFPLFVELKTGCSKEIAVGPTYDILLQSCKRAYNIAMQHHGFLKRVVVFGITGDHLFLVTCFSDEKDETYSLRLELDEVASFLFLWEDLHSQPSSFFFHNHRHMLLPLFNNLSLDWFSVRCNRISSNDRNSVYVIYTSDEKGAFIDCSKVSFVVKISFNCEEAAVMKKILPKYVLGVMSEGKFEYISSEPKSYNYLKLNTSIEQKELIKKIKWCSAMEFDSNYAKNNDFSVIYMKPCQVLKITEEKDYVRLYLNIYKQLEIAHLNGIVHCDIRSSNIMVLENEYMLIDWDLSKPINSKQMLSVGSRFSDRPASLFMAHRCKDYLDPDVIWKPEDDFQMLYEYVYRKNVSFLSTFISYYYSISLLYIHSLLYLYILILIILVSYF